MKVKINSFLFLLYITLFTAGFPMEAQQQTDSVYQVLFKKQRKGWSVSKQLERVHTAYLRAVSEHNVPYETAALNLKIHLFSKLEQYDSIFHYNDQLIHLYLKEKDTSHILESYQNRGEWYQERDSLFPALVTFEKAYGIAQRFRDTITQLRINYYISDLQAMIGLSAESETTITGGLHMIDALSQPEEKTNYLSIYYNQLGILYKERDQYDEALSYYTKCLSLTTDVSDRDIIENNIGNILLEKGNFSEAEHTFRKILESSTRRQDTLQWARALTNLGVTLFHQKNSKALDYLKYGLKLQQIKQHTMGLYSSYFHFAEYYRYVQQPAKAILYAQKAYGIARELRLGKEQLESMKMLMDLGQPSYTPLYLQLRDSLEHSTNRAAQKYMAFKYNYEKEHAAAQENKVKYLQSDLVRQKESQRKILWQFITGFLFALGLALFRIIDHYHKRRELKKILQTENRISKQVHDEIANDLYHTMHKLQQRDSKDDDILEDLDVIYKKTRDISRANNAIDVETDFKATLEDLLIAYHSQQVIVVTLGLGTINWIPVNREKRMTLYRVLQELMINMDKHSHATRVKLSFKQTGKGIRIQYWDNGQGATLSIKNGLLNTENRMAAIGGRITFDTTANEGFKAEIIF